MTFKETSAIVATWIGIASAITGGFFAISAYQRDVHAREEAVAKQADQRVAAAFDIVEDFHQPAFIDLRTRFVEALQDRAHCDDFQPPSRVTAQEVYTLVEYFDRSWMCVESGLCDPSVTRRLLGPYATWWAPVLERHIDQTREQESALPDGSQYGAGIKALATQMETGDNLRCPSTTR